MNKNYFTSLNPGTLFKGIDNKTKKGKAILNTTGWKNDEIGSYGVRWYPQSDIESFPFNYTNHIHSKLSSSHEEVIENYNIYKIANKEIEFDYKKLTIGKPIGMFLGQTIDLGKDRLLLKILDVESKIGWILLSASNQEGDFEIH